MHQAHCSSFQPKICIRGSLLFNMTMNATLHKALCLRVQTNGLKVTNETLPKVQHTRGLSTRTKVTAFKHMTR